MFQRAMSYMLATLMAGFAIHAPAAASGPVAGQWVTEEKDAIVTIKQCGS